MPPRKRRQSAQGDDLVRETGERDTAPLVLGTDSGRRAAPKGSDVGCVAERRSVRQALKQDSQDEGQPNDAAITSPPSIADQAATGRQPTRFSTRIVKRPRRDLSPPESPVKKANKKSSVTVPASASDATATVTTTPETKSKRQWELWSVEDKDSFFEGLCEYGKDFESIHNLIVTKCKKKVTSQPITVKNKEQVRHFYYRTWHKISKLIQPVQDLKKDIQELYGLISYSVLRKKLRGGVNPSDKNWQKLNDLVHQGVATIKVKGKRIRVKTPVCAALKKLNSYEEPKREPGPKVPEKIRLEFRAKTNAAWQHVQDQAHNPRVRVSVRPDRHLLSLVKYLDTKWRDDRIKKKEKMNASEDSQRVFRVYPCRSSTLRHVNLEPIDEPVLQFCLNKHLATSNSCSPSTSKRKKDSKSTSTSAAPPCGSVSDMYIDIAKPVINPSCQCSDTCPTCGLQDTSLTSNVNSGTNIAGNPAGKSGPACTCACNRDGPSCRKALHTFEQADRTKTDTCLNTMSLFESAILESQINKKTADEQRFNCSQKSDGSDVNSRVNVTDKQTLIASKRSAVHEVSSIVDGENAMFPDMMVELCQPDKDSDKPGTGTTGLTSPGSVKSQNESNREPNSCVQETNLNKSVKSSQQELEEKFKQMLGVGWGPGEECQLTFAELYLMFGGNGELRFEYEWVDVETLQTARQTTVQQTLLCNLNNMLRRLSHLATMEITDFNKQTGPSEVCSVCGHNPSSKQKGKVRSPTGKAGKMGRDIATQTSAASDENVPILAGLVSTNQNGLFRVPVLPPVNQSIQPKPATKTSQSAITKEMLQKYNPANMGLARPQMRRRLKPIARNRGLAASNNLVQRTILPKNSEYIAIIPMIPGTQLPASPTQPGVSMETSQPSATVTQTYIGHPLNGIHTQAITVTPTSPAVTTVAGLPLPNIPATDPGAMLSCSDASNTSFSLSPSGDETLLRIPESHLGMMSPRSLKAAGMSAIQDTSQSGMPATIITQAFSHLTSTPIMVTTSSTSPPGNTSNILDISLLSAGDLSLSCLLDDTSSSQRQLSLEPGLVTPPIRTVDPADVPRGNTEGAVRSLFTPTPDTHWLNSEAPDLSLTSFLESPSKPATQSSSSVFNTMSLSLFNENSRDFHTHKLEVDSTLQSMMTESSIDYVKKFADLAEQITQTDPHTSKPDTNNK